MARDYKDRGQPKSRKRTGKKTEQPRPHWLLISCLVFGFIGFLVYLKSTKTEKSVESTTVALAESQATPTPSAKPNPAEAEATAKKSTPTEPTFDFYTLLPGKEVTVPEHEIKTRLREESFGKGKKTRYTVHAGVFRDFKDADQRKAELAMMGIASKIEKVKVGEVVWSRVTLGPYNQLSSVETLKARLKQDSIDVKVTEESQ